MENNTNNMFNTITYCLYQICYDVLESIPVERIIEYTLNAMEKVLEKSTNDLAERSISKELGLKCNDGGSLCKERKISHLEQGKNIGLNDKGNTELHLAVINGDQDKILKLISSLTEKELNKKNNNGDTALHLAVSHQKIEIVKILINNPKIDLVLKNDLTPLELAVTNQNTTSLVRIILEKQIETLQEDDICRFIELANGCFHKDALLELLSYTKKIGDLYQIGTDGLKDNILSLAIEFNKLDILKHIIEDKKINIAPQTKQKLLDSAIGKDHVDIVTYLLSKEVNNEIPRIFEKATKHGSINVIKWIIESKIDKKIIERCVLKALPLAISHDKMNVIEYLFREKLVDKSFKDSDGNTALHLAVYEKNEELIKLFINEIGVNKEARDTKGRTALHLASELSDLNIIKCLKDQKVNINAKDSNGNTVLQIAVIFGRKEIVEKLLEIDIEAHEIMIAFRLAILSDNEPIINLIRKKLSKEIDGECRAALYNLVKDSYYETFVCGFLVPSTNEEEEITEKRRDTILSLAVVSNNKEAVKYILKSHKEFCSKALLLTSKYGNLDMMKFLIEEEKINTMPREKDSGQTLLHLAAANGHNQIIKYLIEKKKLDMNIKDTNNSTPLHYAAAKNQDEVVKYLIEKGANIKSENNNGYTAFNFAAVNGHNNVIRILLEKGININAKDSKGNTALHFAVLLEKMDTIEYLIKNRIRIGEKNNRGDTALHLAFKDKKINEEIVIYLLENTMDTEIKDNEGRTIFHLAVLKENLSLVKHLLETRTININAQDNQGRTAFHLAVLSRKEKIISCLLEQAVNTNIKDNKGQTALHLAASNIENVNGKDNIEIVHYLFNQGIDGNIKNNAGNTVFSFLESKGIPKKDFSLKDENVKKKIETLHEAAASGNMKRIKELLNKKENINSTNFAGQTSLHLAVINNKQEIVNLLLSKGANHLVKDNAGYSPLTYAVIYSPMDSCSSIVKEFINCTNIDKDAIFHSAFMQDRKEVVKYLFQGKQLTEKSSSNALLLAAIYGKLEFMKFLIEEGRVNTMPRDAKNQTLLHLAAAHGHSHLVEYLLKMGVNKDIKNVDGETALHLAVIHGKKDIVELLIRQGKVNKEAKDNNGNTALHLAVIHGKTDIVKYLLEQKVKLRSKNNINKTSLALAFGNPEIEGLLRKKMGNTLEDIYLRVL